MTKIAEEAEKIIKYTYFHNKGLPLEVMLSAMVQDGIKTGLLLAKEIVKNNECDVPFAITNIDKLIEEK